MIFDHAMDSISKFNSIQNLFFLFFLDIKFNIIYVYTVTVFLQT